MADTAVSCVYLFLTRKDQDTCKEMLRELASRALQKGFYLDPEVVVTNFELAVMNALSDHWSLCGQQIYFFPFNQNTWKKIQELGIAVLYRSNEDVRHFIGMLDGMAFLDLNHIEMGIRHLRNNLPPGLDQEEEDALKAVVTYFDETRVGPHGKQVSVLGAI